jgi:2-polyprenyl-3-methyl-5-hydroxy-6-metoxy-1,4-benzoquinol methylase
MIEASRYTADIDLRNPNDSHAFAIASVPARSDVLDVGGADGSVARVLKKTGCRVWAVEQDPHAADLAAEWCEDVVVGDIEELDLETELGRTFDVILFLDILEHLRDPLTVLRNSLRLLTERGYVVISLPNIAHGAVRAQLLSGRFAYTDVGLLDRTHLRFFDPVSVYEFLDDAGLIVLDEDTVEFGLDSTEISVDTGLLEPEVVKDLNGPGADTYQFLFIAAPKNSRAVTDPPFLPARILQHQLQIARRHDVGITRDNIVAELEALRGDSNSRRSVLRQLLGSIRENSERLESELRRS